MRLQVDIKDSILEEFHGHVNAEGRSISDVVRVMILEFNRNRRVVNSKDYIDVMGKRPIVEGKIDHE